MAHYAASFRRSAEKDLRRLDAAIRRRVLRSIDALTVNPRPVGCHKLYGSENAYRIRVGDYRVIYTIDDDILIVAIERVPPARSLPLISDLCEPVEKICRASAPACHSRDRQATRLPYILPDN
jgi:mRNA interferase RelE/StbE